MRSLSGHVKALMERAPGALEPLGAAGGARTVQTAFIDEDMGGTAPPGIEVLEQRGAAEVARCRAGFEAVFARDRRRLRRRGARLLTRRRRHEAIASDVDQTEPVEVSADSRRVALFTWAFLVFMSVASAGLDEAIFEILGLPVLTTWLMALAVGAAQVIALYSAGGRIRDHYEDKGSVGRAVIGVEVGGALALGLAAAYLRAYRLVPLPGLALRVPSFWAAMGVFAAFALVIDAAVLAIGWRFAATPIRTRLVRLRLGRTGQRQLRRAERRVDAQQGRFFAAAEHALGHLALAADVVDRALADSLGAVAAFFEEACAGADAATGAELAVLAEDRASPLEALRDAWQVRRGEAKAELVTLLHAYEPDYRLIEQEAEHPGTDGSGSHDPEAGPESAARAGADAPDGTKQGTEVGPARMELAGVDLEKVGASANGSSPAGDGSPQ